MSQCPELFQTHLVVCMKHVAMFEIKLWKELPTTSQFSSILVRHVWSGPLLYTILSDTAAEVVNDAISSKVGQA